MRDLLMIGLESHVASGVDPGVAPGHTSIPFQADRFGSTSHITPSIPVVEVSSHTHPMPSTSVPIWGLEPRHVNIGGTSYVPSNIPSSSTPIPSNDFLTTHPLPNFSGPSSQISTTSHVHSTSTNIVVS